MVAADIYGFRAKLRVPKDRHEFEDTSGTGNV